MFQPGHEQRTIHEWPGPVNTLMWIGLSVNFIFNFIFFDSVPCAMYSTLWCSRRWLIVRCCCRWLMWSTCLFSSLYTRVLQCLFFLTGPGSLSKVLLSDLAGDFMIGRQAIHDWPHPTGWPGLSWKVRPS